MVGESAYTDSQTAAPFTATFSCDEGVASVSVYYTQDYTAADEENAATAVARDGDSGCPVITGDGQLNFTVILKDGYEINSVSATSGAYKNTKGPADTGEENTYRITKVKKDLTVTVTTAAAAPVVTPASDGVVVNEKTHFIYGLSVGLSAQDCVAVNNGTAVYAYSNEIEALGTGTTVSIYDNNDLLVDTYTIVVFGDVDGDSWYDGTDAYFVNIVANGMIGENALTAAQQMAADCNHDGAIDAADVALLEQAGLLLNSIDQTLPGVELQTNSVYLEYCGLIDQSIEIVEHAPDQPQEPAAEQGSASTVWQIIFDLFKRLVNFVTMIFSIIVIPK